MQRLLSSQRLIHEAWLKLKEKWDKFSIKEKYLVYAASICILIYMVYIVIWSPYLSYLDVLRQRFFEKQQTLLWLQINEKNLRQLSHHSIKTQSPIMLLSQLQKALQQAGLTSAITQLKQTEANTLELQLEKVPFDKTINLLFRAAKQLHLNIINLIIIADSKPGMASIQISFLCNDGG